MISSPITPPMIIIPSLLAYGSLTSYILSRVEKSSNWAWPWISFYTWSLSMSSLCLSLKAALFSFLFLWASSSSLFFLSNSFFFSCLLLISVTIAYLWDLEIFFIESLRISSICSWWSLWPYMSNLIWLYIWGTNVEPIDRESGRRRAPRSTRTSMVSLLKKRRKSFAKVLATIFFSDYIRLFLAVLYWRFLLSISSFFLALASSSRWVSISSASLICKNFRLCLANWLFSYCSITSILACSIDLPTSTCKIGSTSFSKSKRSESPSKI